MLERGVALLEAAVRAGTLQEAITAELAASGLGRDVAADLFRQVFDARGTDRTPARPPSLRREALARALTTTGVSEATRGELARLLESVGRAGAEAATLDRLIGAVAAQGAWSQGTADALVRTLPGLLDYDPAWAEGLGWSLDRARHLVAERAAEYDAAVVLAGDAIVERGNQTVPTAPLTAPGTDDRLLIRVADTVVQRLKGLLEDRRSGPVLRWVPRRRARVELAEPVTGFAGDKWFSLRIEPRGVRARAFTVTVAESLQPQVGVARWADGSLLVSVPATLSPEEATGQVVHLVAAEVDGRRRVGAGTPPLPVPLAPWPASPESPSPESPSPESPSPESRSPGSSPAHSSSHAPAAPVFGQGPLPATTTRLNPNQVTTADLVALREWFIEPFLELAATDPILPEGAAGARTPAHWDRVVAGMQALGLAPTAFDAVTGLIDAVARTDGWAPGERSAVLTSALEQLVDKLPERAQSTLDRVMMLLHDESKLRSKLLDQLTGAGMPWPQARELLDSMEREGPAGERLRSAMPGLDARTQADVAEGARVLHQRMRAMTELYAQLRMPGILGEAQLGMAGLVRSTARQRAAATALHTELLAVGLDHQTATAIVTQMQTGGARGAASTSMPGSMPGAVDLAGRGVWPPTASRLADLFAELHGLGVTEATLTQVAERVLSSFDPEGTAQAHLSRLPGLLHAYRADAALVGAFQDAVMRVGVALVELAHDARWVLADPWIRQSIRGVTMPDGRPAADLLAELGAPGDKVGVPHRGIHIRRRGAYAVVGGLQDFLLPAFEGKPSMGLVRGAAKFLVTGITGVVDERFKANVKVSARFQLSPTTPQAMRRRLPPALAAYAMATGATHALDSGGWGTDLAGSSDTVVQQGLRGYGDAWLMRRASALGARGETSGLLAEGPKPPLSVEALLDQARLLLAQVQVSTARSVSGQPPADVWASIRDVRTELAAIAQALVESAQASRRGTAESGAAVAPAHIPPLRAFVSRRWRVEGPTSAAMLGIALHAGSLAVLAYAGANLVGGTGLGIGEWLYARAATDQSSGIATAELSYQVRQVIAHIDNVVWDGGRDWCGRGLRHAWPSQTPEDVRRRTMPNWRAHRNRAAGPAMGAVPAFGLFGHLANLKFGPHATGVVLGTGFSAMMSELEWWYGKVRQEVEFHQRQSALIRRLFAAGGEPSQDEMSGAFARMVAQARAVREEMQRGDRAE
jgi:hypothetical protein